MRRSLAMLGSVCVTLCACAGIPAGEALLAPAAEEPSPGFTLDKWKRGFAITPNGHGNRRMFVWFYEWTLFDGINRGELSQGDWKYRSVFLDDRRRLLYTLPGSSISLDVRAAEHGAEMLLSITNNSDHDWPDEAAIVPCFHPGPPQSRPKILRRQRTWEFVNEKTYYVNADGLALLRGRDVHFHGALMPQLKPRISAADFAFEDLQPLRDTPAVAGLLIRESNDGRWVAGIAWEEFVTAQGHNPWDCMHLGIRIGPLKRGASKDIRGRIYLFRGTKEECLQRYREDFPSRTLRARTSLPLDATGKSRDGRD